MALTLGGTHLSSRSPCNHKVWYLLFKCFSRVIYCHYWQPSDLVQSHPSPVRDTSRCYACMVPQKNLSFWRGYPTRYGTACVAVIIIIIIFFLWILVLYRFYPLNICFIQFSIILFNSIKSRGTCKKYVY
jgi:hypothetical protein